MITTDLEITIDLLDEPIEAEYVAVKGPKGDPGSPGSAGPQGADGNGIASTVLNSDYTLTITFTDGTSYTTESIRGEQGAAGATGPKGDNGTGISSIVMNQDYTLTITLSDGTSYTTASVRGEKGETGSQGPQGIQGIQGIQGEPGQDGHSPVLTSSKSGSVTTIYSDGTPLATINDGAKGDKGDKGDSGTDDYTELLNKPSINNVELDGDLSLSDIGAASSAEVASLSSDVDVMESRIDTAISAVTTDTEVTDIRVGADGTIYQTAGTAVRSQVTDLKSAIDELLPLHLMPEYIAGSPTPVETVISPTQTLSNSYMDATPKIASYTNFHCNLYPIVSGRRYTIVSQGYRGANTSYPMVGYTYASTVTVGTECTSLVLSTTTISPVNAELNATVNGYIIVLVAENYSAQLQPIIVTEYDDEGIGDVTKQVFDSYINAIIDDNNNVQKIAKIEEEIAPLFKDKDTPMQYTSVQTLYIQANGTLAAMDARFSVNVYPVTQGTKYAIKVDGQPTINTSVAVVSLGNIATPSAGTASTVIVSGEDAEYGLDMEWIASATGYLYVATVTGKPQTIAYLRTSVPAYRPIYNINLAVINGDSIAHGNLTTDTVVDYPFAEYACSQLGIDNITNYAIGGEQISTYGSAETILDHITEMDGTADLVIISIGTNDYGHNVPMGEGESESNTDTFYGALNALYTALMTKYPTKKIIVCTPTKRSDKTGSNAVGKKLVDYRDAIIEIAGIYSIPVCDMWAISGLNPQFNSTQYYKDGLHPLQTGHYRMGEILKNALTMML